MSRLISVRDFERFAHFLAKVLMGGKISCKNVNQ